MRPANEAVYWLTGSFGERQPRVPTAGDFSNRELTVSRHKTCICFHSLSFSYLNARPDMSVGCAASNSAPNLE